MNKTLFTLALLISFAGSAFAEQQVNFCTGGGWVPLGVACPPGGGSYSNYGSFNGYQVGIPNGIGYGQPFGAMVGGQQMRCTLADRAVSGGVGAVLGGLLGLAGDRLTKGGGHKYAEAGLALGAAAGASLLCDPYIVDDTPQQWVVIQQQGGQWNGGGQPQIRHQGPTQGDTSHCVIDQKDWPGLSREKCLELRVEIGRLMPKTETTPPVTPDASDRDTRDPNITKVDVLRFHENCKKESKTLVFVPNLKAYRCAPPELARNDPRVEIVN